MVGTIRSAFTALTSLCLAGGCTSAPEPSQQETAVTPNVETPRFRVSELVTNERDADLVNPWGLVGKEGAFWLADNGTGRVSIYDGEGRPSREYPPGSFALDADITGVASLDDAAFVLGCAGPAEFIFATQQGTLIAINEHPPRGGTKVVDRSKAGAVYLGVAKIDSPIGPMLLANDFKNGRIDMFDSRFRLVDNNGAFVDDTLPDGFGPFNVMALGDHVYVTYAKGDNGEEQPGPGRGRVDIFDTSGALQTRIESDRLDTPWGLATDSTSDNIGLLYVGNFGDGHITVFDVPTHRELGQLDDENGDPLVLDGLWGLALGGDEAGDPGALYFTSGPSDETAGIFGRIDRIE